METLKQEIKKLSSQQKDLKLQRKTVTFKGNRTLTSQEAINQHSRNRRELSYLYFVHGILKGKSREEMLLCHKVLFMSEKYLTELINKYQVCNV